MSFLLVVLSVRCNASRQAEYHQFNGKSVCINYRLQSDANRTVGAPVSGGRSKCGVIDGSDVVPSLHARPASGCDQSISPSAAQSRRHFRTCLPHQAPWEYREGDTLLISGLPLARDETSEGVYIVERGWGRNILPGKFLAFHQDDHLPRVM